MYHDAVKRNLVHMFPEDLNIINNVRSRSRQFLSNARRIPREEE